MFYDRGGGGGPGDLDLPPPPPHFGRILYPGLPLNFTFCGFILQGRASSIKFPKGGDAFSNFNAQ